MKHFHSTRPSGPALIIPGSVKKIVMEGQGISQRILTFFPLITQTIVHSFRSDLMVKKLRYYARFIVVCLLLKKMKIVRELVRVRLVLKTSLMYCFISIYFCLRNCPNMWMSTPALTNQTTSWNGPWCWVKLSLSSKQMPFSIFWMQIPIPWSSLTGTSSSFFFVRMSPRHKKKRSETDSRMRRMPLCTYR